MTNDEVIRTIQNLMNVLREFAPDEPYYEEWGIDNLMEDGRDAINFLRGNDNG